MNINFIAMGKLKESWYREACAEYMKRLGAYVSPKVIEPSPVDLPQKPSQAQIDAALRQEAAKIREQIKPGSFTVAMCMNFLVGSSFGLDEELKKQADLRLSMSPMTFPHSLARVMLMEQVYRAYSILNNGKYHK